MSHQTNYVDPRTKIEHTLDDGQVYEDARTGEELVLVFLSDDAALLQDDETGGHRLEQRSQFEANVGSGRYTLQSSTDTTTSSKLATLEQLHDRYDEQNGRKAEHKANALAEAIELIENNGEPDDYETIDYGAIDGIGSKAASALQANGFTTKGDIRGADDETIIQIPHMGEKNTSNLRGWVQ